MALGVSKRHKEAKKILVCVSIISTKDLNEQLNTNLVPSSLQAQPRRVTSLKTRREKGHLGRKS